MTFGKAYKLYCAALLPFTDRPVLLKGFHERGLSIEAAKLEIEGMEKNGIAAFQDPTRKAQIRKRVMTLQGLKSKALQSELDCLEFALASRIAPDAAYYARERIRAIRIELAG